MKGKASLLRIALLDEVAHEKTGLVGVGPHLWRVAARQGDNRGMGESVVLEKVPPDAAFEDEDVPFLAFLEAASMEEIIRLPKGDLELRTLGWHAPTGLHRCHRADVRNGDLKVLPQRSSTGACMGLGLQYMGSEAIEEGVVVAIGIPLSPHV